MKSTDSHEKSRQKLAAKDTLYNQSAIFAAWL